MIEYKETHACSLTLVKTDDLDKKGTLKTSNKMQLERVSSACCCSWLTSSIIHGKRLLTTIHDKKAHAFWFLHPKSCLAVGTSG